MEFNGSKITRKALGRIGNVGSLYNIIEDRLYSSSCFTTNVSERYILTEDVSTSTQTIYFNSDSFIKSFLNVNHGMSVLFALCDKTTNYSSLYDNTFLDYQATILREYQSKETCLNFSQDLLKLIDFNKISMCNATHVVIGIKWGSTTIVNLKRTHGIIEEHDKQNLYNWFISAATDGISGDEATTYMVAYNGDVLNKNFPSQSIQEVIDTLKDISTKHTITIKQYEYILCSIADIANYFNQTITMNVNFQELQESEESPLVYNSINILRSFLETNQKLKKTLMEKADIFAEYIHEKDSALIKDKYEKLEDAREMFNAEVTDMIIQVRSNLEKEEKLSKLIDNSISNIFSTIAEMQKWLENSVELSKKLDNIERILLKNEIHILKNTTDIQEVFKTNQYSCVWYGSTVAEEWNKHFNEFNELRNDMINLYLETLPDIHQRFFIINYSDMLAFSPHDGPPIHLYFDNMLVTNDLYTLSTRSIWVSIVFEENDDKKNTKVEVRLSTTVSQIIVDSCNKLNLEWPNDYFLTVDNIFLERSLSITKTNICLPSSIKCLHKKPIAHHSANEDEECGNKLLFSSVRELQANEVMNIQFPFNIEQVIPDFLMSAYNDIQQHNTHSSDSQLTTLPLPVFNRTIIDDLPRICLTIPLHSSEFDWSTLLNCLACDLEVDVSELIVISAEQGSTKLELILSPKNASSVEYAEKILKVKNKLAVFVLDEPSNVKDYLQSTQNKEVNTICAELKKFSPNDLNYLSLVNSDTLSVFLRLHERPTIMSEEAWHFLIEKSHEINKFITHSFNHHSFNEYIINSIALIHNPKLYETFKTFPNSNQKILFHGTSKLDNIDGIFETNYHFVGKTDAGWFGKGIYFTSSPKYALRYARKSKDPPKLKEIYFIICNIVSLGKILTVKSIDEYHGKEMNPSYDSHYVRVGIEPNIPVSNEVSEYYEEYVIKDKKQVLPMYVIGISRINKLVVWRDAKIKNQSNSNLFNKLKERFSFNIYECETSMQAIALLTNKLSSNKYQDRMHIRVVTNGADDGQKFIEECRKLQNDLPIIIYCMDLQRHDAWASSFDPIIKVTGTKDEVFEFIRELEQE